MSKLSVVICAFMVLIAIGAKGREYSKVNLYLQPSMVIPTGDMSTYYGFGGGCAAHIVASLSKRKSICRVSLALNAADYHFGGKTWWDAGFNEHTSDPINVIPLHAGIRLDLGNTRDTPMGFYISQDVGETYIAGPTGGWRYGHAFDMGFVFGRCDMAMGFERWKRSVGGNFGFFVFGLGLRVF